LERHQQVFGSRPNIQLNVIKICWREIKNIFFYKYPEVAALHSRRVRCHRTSRKQSNRTGPRVICGPAPLGHHEKIQTSQLLVALCGREALSSFSSISEHKYYRSNVQKSPLQCAEPAYTHTHTHTLWMGVNISSRVHLRICISHA